MLFFFFLKQISNPCTGQSCNLHSVVALCTMRGQCSIVLKYHLHDLDLQLWWGRSADRCMPKIHQGGCSRVSADTMLTRPQLTGDSDFWAPSPLVFLFFSAWKQNKAQAGGAQNDIGTLHIVPSASSSTFLGWLWSGPPALGYCWSSTEPQTWPQLTTAASTDHCGAQAEWWLSLPQRSSLLSISHTFSDFFTRICCLSLSASLSSSWSLFM